MKRIYFLMALFCGMVAGFTHFVEAQNIQLHYDFGHHSESLDSRPALTTTIEHFRPDNWGSTFYFVDMDYKDSAVKSAYWEIGRDLKFWQAPVALHLEYNGGLSNQFSYNGAYLAGLTYAYSAKDYSYGFSLTPTYKHIAKAERPHSVQLTGVWYWHMFDKLLSFTGFFDVWGVGLGGKQASAVFLSEPQLWFNLNELEGVPAGLNLSLGGEVEMSYNFVGSDQFFAIPTLAAKWTF